MPADTVLCLGHCTLDTIGVVPRMPPIDTKAELHEFTILGGGAAATAGVTLASLGVKTRFVGKIGDDPRGTSIRMALNHVGIDVSHMIVEDGAVSQFNFVVVESSTGSRTSYWTGGSVTPMSPGDVEGLSLEGITLLHIDGHHPEAQLAVAARAKALGITVVFDAGDLSEANRLLVAVTDVLIASERFASAFSGLGEIDEAIENMRAAGPDTVIITMGAEGSIGRDASGRHYQAPIHIADERDTIGVGDVYRGAYIHRRLQNATLGEAMAFATAAASLSLRHLGGRGALASVSEIDQLLNTVAGA